VIRGEPVYLVDEVNFGNLACLCSYMPAELLATSQRHPSADMFSVGITLLELAGAVATPLSPSSVYCSTSHQGPPLPCYSTGDNSMLSLSPRVVSIQSRKPLSSLNIPAGGPMWHILRKEDVDEHIPPRISKTLRNVICSCMCANPLSRCSANDVLNLSEVQSHGASVDSFLDDEFPNLAPVCAITNIGQAGSGSDCTSPARPATSLRRVDSYDAMLDRMSPTMVK
jgi:serine/threonine protein kinase